LATTSLPPSARETTTDGRSARAARTRDAVVESLLSLLDDGNVRPTARQVAERAGVSLRSVYVHFDDLEDLFTAAAHRFFERHRELIKPLPHDGPLEERLDAFVDQRARMHDAARSIRRAAVLQEPFSPALAEVLALGRRLARGEVKQVFSIEIEQREQPDRRRFVTELDVVAGGTTWESLRGHHGLSCGDAREVMRAMLRAILQAD
jgi:TetR/AcrR family transcriptional regulator, regulator of autoinduction and epiphytic fitness